MKVTFVVRHFLIPITDIPKHINSGMILLYIIYKFGELPSSNSRVYRARICRDSIRVSLSTFARLHTISV